MKGFVTETDPSYIRKLFFRSCGISFVAFTLFACLGFLVSWQFFLFLELVVLIATLATAISKKSQFPDCVLRFEGDRLFITYRKNHKEFEVYDIPASDFVITQSKKEVPLDYCSLHIKKTVFVLGGVKRCTELKQYITDTYR